MHGELSAFPRCMRQRVCDAGEKPICGLRDADDLSRGAAPSLSSCLEREDDLPRPLLVDVQECVGEQTCVGPFEAVKRAHHVQTDEMKRAVGRNQRPYSLPLLPVGHPGQLRVSGDRRGSCAKYVEYRRLETRNAVARRLSRLQRGQNFESASLSQILRCPAGTAAGCKADGKRWLQRLYSLPGQERFRSWRRCSAGRKLARTFYARCQTSLPRLRQIRQADVSKIYPLI